MAHTPLKRAPRPKQSAQVFKTTAKLLDLTYAELARRIGFSTNASYEWIRYGIMPVSAALACAALRDSKTNLVIPTVHTHIVIELSDSTVTRTRKFIEPKIKKYKKREFYLIPVESAPE